MGLRGIDLRGAVVSATVYYAIVRYHATGNNQRLLYASATERALQLIALSPYITVIEEGLC